MALPKNDTLRHVQKMGIAALSELVVMLIVVAFANCIMLQFTRLYQKKEVFLNASLIKQKQATQQAERKSMNKSLAFASANHDIRTILAGITGLIELSRGVVSQKSEVYNNLDQMSVCASKLLGWFKIFRPSITICHILFSICLPLFMYFTLHCPEYNVNTRFFWNSLIFMLIIHSSVDISN